MEHLNHQQQPLQKTSNQAKHQAQKRRDNQEQLVNDRDLLIAKQRREEIEKQNEAALRIAKQQEELELERLEPRTGTGATHVES